MLIQNPAGPSLAFCTFRSARLVSLVERAPNHQRATTPTTTTARTTTTTATTPPTTATTTTTTLHTAAFHLYKNTLYFAGFHL